MQERNSYYPSGLRIDALSSTPTGAPDVQDGWAGGRRAPAATDFYGQLHGRRYLDPAISSWYAVEPLATQYAGVSPYNYALGDPVNLRDATGFRPGGPEWQLGLDGSNGLGWADVIGPGGQPRGLSLWQQRGIHVSGNDYYSDGFLAEKLSWEQIKSDFAFENTWYVSATAANRRAVQQGIASGQISPYDGSSAKNLLGYLVGAESLGMLGSDANSLVNNDGWRNYVAKGDYAAALRGIQIRDHERKMRQSPMHYALAGGGGDGNGGWGAFINSLGSSPLSQTAADFGLFLLGSVTEYAANEVAYSNVQELIRARAGAMAKRLGAVGLALSVYNFYNVYSNPASTNAAKARAAVSLISSGIMLLPNLNPYVFLTIMTYQVASIAVDIYNFKPASK